ncbi:MAG: hypothetical protein B7O98_05340 [Zestosphaera tikiterensis]|uniref:Transglutaminase-like domain-containing protein n=1 Tax=Zestosphaera tikiterensis TaxID=1973259 RepID=A0A2R7Y5S2_9CREN|nr:MAG: hypothetical protein B7O98_05340 [Zestosphaera tikiterensis]
MPSLKVVVVTLVVLNMVFASLFGYFYSEFLSLKQDYQTLSNKYDSLTNQYSMLLNNYNVLKSNYDTLKNQYDQLKDSYNELTARYSRLLNNYSVLKNDYNMLKNQYEQLLNDYEALKNDYVKITTQYNELLNNYNILNNNYVALQNQYNSLLSDYSTLNNKYNDLNKKYSLLQEDYDKLSINYNMLKEFYDSLVSKYEALVNMYNSLKTEYESFISWYNSIKSQVNLRQALEYEDWMKFITPEDPAIKSLVINVTGGWSNQADINELWNDILKMYLWVKDSIYYSYDSPEPILPELNTSLMWRREFWRFPNETARDLTGDCEDMANLLASMILNYNGKKRIVWVLLVVFEKDNETVGHATVALPETNGKLAIVDPAGRYYTNMPYALTAKDVTIALQEYFSYWSQSGCVNGRVYAIYSYNMYKLFSSNEEFTNYVRNLS